MSAKAVVIEELEIKEASEAVRTLQSTESQATAPTLLTDTDVVALSLDNFPANVALPCSVYLKVNGKYVLFRGQGEKLTTKRVMELNARGASTLYVQEKSWKVFCAFLEKVPAEARGDTKLHAQHVRQVMLLYGRELERRNREARKQLLEKMQRHAAELAGLLKKDPSLAHEMLSRHAQTDTGHFASHSLNTAIYAALIGIRAGIGLEDLKVLTYGAMVHDVGKLTLDKKLLNKSGTVSAEEVAELRTHSRAGAELLQSYTAIPAVILSVLQHHERFDGTGYPAKLKGETIHPFARIISIADAFDSLTSDRPHRKKVSAADALRQMAADQGRFDPKYLTAVPKGE